VKSEVKFLPLLPLRGILVFPYMVIHLDVGREKSVQAIEEAMIQDRIIFLATQREAQTDDPGVDDIYQIGTVAEVKQLLKLPGGTIRVLVEGISRARIRRFLADEPFFQVEVDQYSEVFEKNSEIEALMRSLVYQFEQYVKLSKRIPPETVVSVVNLEEPGRLADIIASHLALRIDDKQNVLEAVNIVQRLEKLCALVAKELEIKESAIADPGPLGLACFALTTFCLSMVNAGLVVAESVNVVIALALVYGGTVQVLAGMWEFKKNNVFGATAFSSYGGFWVSFGLFELLAVQKVWVIPPQGVWLFLLAWTIFTAYMWIGSFGTNKALIVTFTLLLLTFILLTIGAAGNHAAHTWGGYLGIVTAFAAWYTSAAGIFNTVFGRAVLPVGTCKK
jgi:succinate-acetate transporter protein/Lon protease-like protein